MGLFVPDTWVNFMHPGKDGRADPPREANRTHGRAPAPPPTNETSHARYAMYNTRAALYARYVRPDPAEKNRSW